MVVSGGGEWQTKFSVSPGPGLWSLVLSPFGPDLGPGPELDNLMDHSDLVFKCVSLTCAKNSKNLTN